VLAQPFCVTQGTVSSARIAQNGGKAMAGDLNASYCPTNNLKLKKDDMMYLELGILLQRVYDYYSC
jgi:hypothetical protein